MNIARFKTFKYWHEVILLGLLLILFLWAGTVEPLFIQFNTQLELSTHIWEMALLAIPMTLIIITAGIDLSVGSALALCAVVLGLTYEQGIPPVYGAALAILAGGFLGLMNGYFVAYVRVHPLIVTLATLAAFRGVAEGISTGRPISGFPESFAWIGRGTFGGIPIPGYIFILFACVIAIVLARTITGRSLYAIGHNEKASRYSGIPVARLKMLLYTLASLCAGLAAVMLVARRNTAKADLGTGLELEVITAVVLGGTSIFGGRGRIIGTVLGILVIHEVREFVSWHWNREELNLIVIGLLLLAAVLVNKLFSQKERDSE